jgi:transposase InsO family protein
MIPDPTVFKSYKSLSGKEKVQIADGTFCSIAGIGNITCTPNIQLFSVLHVSNFTNNLMSVSQLVDDLNCIVSLSPSNVVVHELKMGKVIGIGKRNEDLYKLEQRPDVLDAKAYFAGNPEMEIILWHRRLGHTSFSALERIFPDLFKKCSRSELVCDACEFAKHTRTTYPSFGSRSSNCFDIIYFDVWGPSRVASLSGFRWFVTFIDCCSRVIWLFLMRSKSKVPDCFRNFQKMVETQYGKRVKILRSDNGTEYTNKSMQDFLRSEGIVHQTTCVNTPEQNGVAERNNRHILEVIRCLLFSMNVPRYLWVEAIKTAIYLINRMLLRAVDFHTPLEILTGKNAFKVPPKTFGCVCFVHNTTPGVSKLDIPAHKCVFVGYSRDKKGYRCFDPVKRKMYESMDMTFRESEPYFSSASVPASSSTILSDFLDIVPSPCVNRISETS